MKLTEKTKLLRKGTHYLYLIECGPFIKIGMSKDPKKRLAALQTSNPVPLDIKWKYGTKYHIVKKMESVLHLRFWDKRTNGEWFDLKFDDIIDEVKRIAALDIIELAELMEQYLNRFEEMPGRDAPRIRMLWKRHHKKLKNKRNRQPSLYDKNNTVMTEDLLSKILTKGCGLKRHVAQELGVGWPARRRWKKTVIGKTYPTALINSLMPEPVKKPLPITRTPPAKYIDFTAELQGIYG